MRYTGVDFDPISGNLSVQIDEGRIDSIKITGNDLTKPFVIMREFPLEKGDVFNANQVKHGIANIYNTQLFEKVNVTIDQSEQGYDLIIKVLKFSYRSICHLIIYRIKQYFIQLKLFSKNKQNLRFLAETELFFTLCARAVCGLDRKEGDLEQGDVRNLPR